MNELYVLARRVLLDALEALMDHREAIVLVGAQAVYLHVGDADLAVAPYTSDGDLVIDPALLSEIPPIETALRDAGFFPRKADSVGVWVARRSAGEVEEVEVCVDLLVPARVSPGKGRRAARLVGHDARAARKVVGLEGALVDVERMQLGALADGDSRILDVQVAGPAALLVAKLLKIDDRTGTERHSDKDALDIARLLRGVDTEDLSRRMQNVLADERSTQVANQAIELLRATFGRRESAGVKMAVRATGGLVDGDELAVSCALLAREFLEALET
ncbi:MAG: hypothetical protein JRF33_06385 [Deltaproteobacteria bacterium]|nr:hypothetical protein [Deltaproteobacteria bacterium]